MFSNTKTNTSPSFSEKNNIKNIYQKFQILLGRGSDNISRTIEDNMLSARESTVASEDSFMTPASSAGDLLTMSPKQSQDTMVHLNVTDDLLTGTDFDSICDVTMHEVPMFDDNMFMDATSLDYLVKRAESYGNHNIMDRGKESLFVKFDPLYAKQGLDEPSELGECDVGYETGSSASVLADAQPGSPKHSMSVLTHMNKDKPTQVVPPVVNNGSQPQNVTQTRSTPALVRSVSAILAPTHVATERLISINNTPPTAAPRSPRFSAATPQVDRLHSLRIILQKQDQEIMQLTQENRDLKSSLRNVEYHYTQKVENMETKIKKLTEERDNLLDRENKLIQQVNDKIMSNKQMSIVMEEYEKTISSLIGEQQQDQIHYQEMEQRLTNERDQSINHLASMESSFNDLLTKYEKCKAAIMSSKERENVLEQNMSEYQKEMKRYEELYNDLKIVTSNSLNKANETLDSMKRNYNDKITKLSAMIKKHEITIASLQESLSQKTRDNEELTRICDQLINEVR